jgi:hypothetical protein
MNKETKVINAIKVCTDGNMYPVKFKENSLADMYSLLNCSNIEIVHAMRLNGSFCLVCDGEALLKDSPQINLYASYLYGSEQHRNYIYGDVLICKEYNFDEDFEDDEDESDFQSMTQDEIDYYFLQKLFLVGKLKSFADDTERWLKGLL